MSDTPSNELEEVLPLLADIQLKLDQVRARVATALGESSPTPTLSARDLARVEAVGEVAYRHWLFIEENGSMTLGDSLAIRRAMYGDRVRSTANLFGKQGSGALFHRTTPYGEPRKDDQEVKLTDEGVRIANLWRLVHPDNS